MLDFIIEEVGLMVQEMGIAIILSHQRVEVAEEAHHMGIPLNCHRLCLASRSL